MCAKNAEEEPISATSSQCEISDGLDLDTLVTHDIPKIHSLRPEKPKRNAYRYHARVGRWEVHVHLRASNDAYSIKVLVGSYLSEEEAETRA